MWPHVGEGVPGLTELEYGVVVAHRSVCPSPRSNVVPVRVATRWKVNPLALAVAVRVVGPSTQSHTG